MSSHPARSLLLCDAGRLADASSLLRLLHHVAPPTSHLPTSASGQQQKTATFPYCRFPYRLWKAAFSSVIYVIVMLHLKLNVLHIEVQIFWGKK